MENDPGSVNAEKWANMAPPVPGEVIASGEVLESQSEPAEKAPETALDNSRALFGREALNRTSEVLRPAEAMQEGPVDASAALFSAPETALGTTGVDGQDIVDDAKTEAIGTDNPEKFRKMTVKKFIDRAKDVEKLAGDNPKKAQDDLTGASWEYMRVMFGRNMGDGITGQKGGLAA